MDVMAPHRWLEGALAIGIANRILTTPGVCAIDFETYPTSPRWHRRQAAAGAERGQKVKAGDQAELDARLDGRAHKRTACTLQLHHSDGAEVFVRLRDPATELPAMFAGHVASLVAHNAQFETEILVRHGVEADIECTLVAAKCLYLVAVPEDEPQPVEFSLAALVERELGRVRDKTIRDRDWRHDDSLDSDAVEYGLQDVRDTLQLWMLYERLLRERGLFAGYRVMQGSILPTAAINVRGGLVRDKVAHTTLIADMQIKAADAADKLDRIAHHAIANPGSDAQVSTWINEQVLGYPLKAPVKPKVVDLKQFLRSRGGLRPDPGGELAARDLGNLVQLIGMSLEDATVTAEEHGYIRPAYGSRCEERDLLAALDLPRCLTVEDQMAVDQYEQDEAYFQAHHVVDPERKHTFNRQLEIRTDRVLKIWHTTKIGHLGLRRGSSLRKAEIIREAFPKVAEYLVQRAHWRKAQKLIDAFGATLSAWDDGIVRGQHKVYGAWTGRQSCADPNLQNQPHDKVFRAVWVAAPERKLVIADYCLTGDTPVVTVDGVRPIADVVARPSDVLSMAPRRKLEFRKVERAALIGVAPVVRMTFADGSSVRCTLDHEWVDRAGMKVKTADLKPGDRLEHVHDGINGGNGYPTWYVRSQREYVCKHRLVAGHVLGVCPPGHEVDHVDGDPDNWAGVNLRYLPVAENRGQAAGRWWARADDAARARKTADLVRGQRENRRSYDGAGNPNFGKRKGAPAVCRTCGVEFYKPPSRGQIYCSMDCRRGNHHVVSIVPAGVEPIYHLTVEQNHNFVLGNGLVSSNSQIELRLLAIESGDAVMQQIYRDDRDVHREVASIAFNIPLEDVTPELRTRAKAISFGIAYGSGASGLAEHGGFELAEAHGILARVLAAYPGLNVYRERAPREAAAQGFIAIRPGRRVKYTPDSVGTTAINAPIQGGAASVQNRALRLVHEALPPWLDAHLAAAVHDEIIVDSAAEDAEDAAAILVEGMVTALTDIYPESEAMGLANLTAAVVVDRWSDKP